MKRLKRFERVKCKNNRQYQDRLTVGKSYLVCSDEKSHKIYITDDNGQSLNCHVGRFERQSGYKIGDIIHLGNPNINFKITNINEPDVVGYGRNEYVYELEREASGGTQTITTFESEIQGIFKPEEYKIGDIVKLTTKDINWSKNTDGEWIIDKEETKVDFDYMKGGYSTWGDGFVGDTEKINNELGEVPSCRCFNYPKNIKKGFIGVDWSNEKDGWVATQATITSGDDGCSGYKGHKNILIDEFMEETKMEEPKTKLEKTACERAKEEAIEKAIESKKLIYSNKMGYLINLKNDIIGHEEILNKRKEEYAELAKVLGITKDDEKQLF